jgi:hypothetical protein
MVSTLAEAQTVLDQYTAAPNQEAMRANDRFYALIVNFGTHAGLPQFIDYANMLQSEFPIVGGQITIAGAAAPIQPAPPDETTTLGLPATTTTTTTTAPPADIGATITSLPVVGPLISSLSTATGISPMIIALVALAGGLYAFGVFDGDGGSRRR